MCHILTRLFVIFRRYDYRIADNRMGPLWDRIEKIGLYEKKKSDCKLAETL